MTALAIGSSVTVTLSDDGFAKVATNGGIGSVVITPTVGLPTTEKFGPQPHRKVYGPYGEGCSLASTNGTCISLDYDSNASGFGAASMFRRSDPMPSMSTPASQPFTSRMMNSIKSWF